MGDPARRQRRRRKVAGVLVFAALVAALVAARQLGRPSTTPAPGPPRPAAGTAPVASADVSRRVLVMQREAIDLSKQAGAVGVNSAATRVVRLSPTRAALVLVPRLEPYTVTDLLAFPEAATRSSPQEVILHLPVVVPRDAALTIDSTQTRSLRLASSPAGFAAVVGLGGSIRLAGSAVLPLEVSTVDPGTGAADERLDDGRGFLLNLRGRMDLTHVQASRLGFGQGMASGVAWAGTAYEPARGEVTHSTFRQNRYGAYTFHALGMTWTDDTFEDNQVYGLAAHDFSSDFQIRRSSARRNGRHGFALSRGCHDNLLEGNRSEANLGDGFALDDAPIGGRGLPRGAAVVSTGNVLRDNTAASNGGSGVDVHGGRGTVLVGNRLHDNQLGARYSATASGTLEANQVHRNAVFGIGVEASAGDVVLRGNLGSGSWADLLTARDVEQSGNSFVVERATRPAPHRTLVTTLWDIANALGSRPALAAWLIVLGVPALARLVHRL